MPRGIYSCHRPENFRPLRFGLAVIMAAKKFKGFDWRREPYEFEVDRLAIDLLLGDENIRVLIEKNAPLKEIENIYEEEEENFKKIRASYLHY